MSWKDPTLTCFFLGGGFATRLKITSVFIALFKIWDVETRSIVLFSRQTMILISDCTDEQADPTSVIPVCINEPRHEKTNVLVSDLVPHKPGCTATEDG